MARLAADAKMGYYPIPEESLYRISRWIEFGSTENNYHALDPCCGCGSTLCRLAPGGDVNTWGIELDIDRAATAGDYIQRVICGSMFSAQVSPKAFGLLWLNPPYDYDTDGGGRMEMKFLRHAEQWLAANGVLVFIVPEHILNPRNLLWIEERFEGVCICRVARGDYPQFKQVVLIGKKRRGIIEAGPYGLPPGPYPHIEDMSVRTYVVPETAGPAIFQAEEAVTDAEVMKNRPQVLAALDSIFGIEKTQKAVSPLLPLRKGHLIALIMAGMLNGKIETGPGRYIAVKGYSDRVETTREEDGKEITRSSYHVGIRVIEEGGWYDVK